MHNEWQSNEHLKWVILNFAIRLGRVVKLIDYDEQKEQPLQPLKPQFKVQRCLLEFYANRTSLGTSQYLLLGGGGVTWFLGEQTQGDQL